MTEEGETECGIRTNAVEAAFGGIGDLLNGVGAQIGEFLRLQIAPDVLDWIEIRWCAGQSGEV